MSTNPTIIPQISALKEYVGKPLGTTDWSEISQAQIDAFAEATGDHQWIHVDHDRASAESPFGQTIAHGYLTIALAPVLLQQLFRVENISMAINSGIDKMRLPSPVPSGSRLRMSAEIKNVRDMPGGGARVTIAVTFETEGVTKPACVADVVYVYLP
jgi:acyl dehydratase